MRRFLIYMVCSILALITWEYVGRSNNNVRLLLSYPSLAYQYFVTHAKILGIATLYTFLESFIGLLLAVIFSFSVMFLCFYFPRLVQFWLPIMIASQVIPLITLAPLLIISFGIGMASKIIMAALMCFFPLFINFLSGYVSIPKTTNEMLYLYGASTWFRITRVNVPLSLPGIFAGLKVSATLSVIGAVVAEFNGADYGLGKNLFLAAKRLEPELMITSIIITALLGGIMYGTTVLLERKVGGWYL